MFQPPFVGTASGVFSCFFQCCRERDEERVVTDVKELVGGEMIRWTRCRRMAVATAAKVVRNQVSCFARYFRELIQMLNERLRGGPSTFFQVPTAEQPAKSFYTSLYKYASVVYDLLQPGRLSEIIIWCAGIGISFVSYPA